MAGLWNRVPAPVQGLVWAAALLAPVVLGWGNGDDRFLPGDDGLWFPLLNLVVLLTLGWNERRRERALGGRARARLLERSLKSGFVPAGIDPEGWRAPLERIVDDRSDLWTAGFLAAGIVVLAGRDTVPVLEGAGGVGAPSLMALLGLICVIGRRRARRARALLAHIDERSSR